MGQRPGFLGCVVFAAGALAAVLIALLWQFLSAHLSWR